MKKLDLVVYDDKGHKHVCQIKSQFNLYVSRCSLWQKLLGTFHLPYLILTATLKHTFVDEKKKNETRSY